MARILIGIGLGLIAFAILVGLVKALLALAVPLGILLLIAGIIWHWWEKGKNAGDG